VIVGLTYAQHGNTPNRRGVPSTPRSAHHELNINRSPTPSPTPRGQHGDGNTTNLLEFTETFNALSRYPTQASPSRRSRHSPSKSQTQPDLASYFSCGRTPSPGKNLFPSTPSESRHLATLLDFDIPPAPTPRSVPSITPRELESLKSSYLSQISSLKASLSGKEAEVSSLKEAVGDAERRVGEALETIREERGLKEQLQAEQRDWEKRGKEMEVVLRSVKDEIIRGEREKEEMAQKLEESEHKREEAEAKVVETENRVAGMRLGSASTNPGSDINGSESSMSSTKEVEAAVEKVARELHSLYKSKHETKVAALKKSYETRWDKKVKELEKKLEEANKEIDELRVGRDATMSGVVVHQIASAEEKVTRVEEAQKAEEQKAKLAGLTKELESIKRDNRHLLQELEKERVEKGELVAAVDEMLLLSAATGPGDGAPSGLETLRGSISRASGASMMRGIAFNPSSSLGASGESRIGKVSSGSSRSRSGSAMGNRSGIMSNIERMGRGRSD
jgi:Fungal Transforming acidic coiled-coil (TACC) proteins